MSLVDRKIVLSLNAGWQAIGVRTVAEAFVAMMGGNNNNPPVKALDISYSLKENGEYNFDECPSIMPVSWIDWIALPIREHDLVINTSKNKIRVPRVVVSVNYNKIPKRRFRPTKSVLYELQKGICGYTGEKISMKQGNIEHKTPKSLGGRETFENLMVVKSDINSKRGNKPLEDLGLVPIFTHKEPRAIPMSYTIKNSDACRDWQWFIKQ